MAAFDYAGTRGVRVVSCGKLLVVVRTLFLFLFTDLTSSVSIGVPMLALMKSLSMCSGLGPSSWARLRLDGFRLGSFLVFSFLSVKAVRWCRGMIALDAGGAIPIVRSFSSHLSRIPRHFVCCRGIHVERT